MKILHVQFTCAIKHTAKNFKQRPQATDAGSNQRKTTRTGIPNPGEIYQFCFQAEEHVGQRHGIVLKSVQKFLCTLFFRPIWRKRIAATSYPLVISPLVSTREKKNVAEEIQKKRWRHWIDDLKKLCIFVLLLMHRCMCMVADPR